MKSNATYTVGMLLLLAIALMSGPFGLPSIINLLFISPLTAVILPVAMSRGPIRTRVTRTLLLSAVTMCTEFAAAGTYGLLTGSTPHPSVSDEYQLIPFFMSYMVAILFNALATEGVIALCRRENADMDPSLRFPMFALILGTHFAGGAMSIRMYLSHTYRSSVLIGVFVTDLLTLAVALVALDLTQRELLASQRAADQAALIRQSRHLKSEVLNIASSSVATRRLRHDLANQVDVIDELLEEGRMGAAEQYLSELQRRAQALAND